MLSEFLTVFRSEIAHRRAVPFDRFVELALYDPQCGYYRANRKRIGRERGTDFFTATSSGPLFGELIAAASTNLLGDRDPGDYVFWEIGAEATGGVMSGVQHPFARAETRSLGDSLNLEGKCVVFSNELFDAQPFRRFQARGGLWHEVGVTLAGDSLVEADLGPIEAQWLPASPIDGYRFDAPRASLELLRNLVRQSWEGLFVACDYGKSLRELAEATPGGTARGYWKHTQVNDLLARPGEQDLTVHVCWDWLEECLHEHRFLGTMVESQESFFVRRAGHFIEASLAADPGPRGAQRRSLIQLLHPAHLGQKFQVLHATRW